MRHVVINPFPTEDWFKKWIVEAERITELLKNAPSNQERQKIIDDNEKHWRNDKFRNWLIELFHNKCWYSEAKDAVSSYHVDHFRPKGRVTESKGTFREGYWWLAFNVHNYRISGELLNVKKGDWFPLNYGSPAQPFDTCGLEMESYILLDPCAEGDAALLSFDESGEATEAVDIDAIERSRVEQTIDILGLNRLPRLVEKRRETWVKCFQAILSYKNSPHQHQALKAVYKAAAVTTLKDMVKYEEEFSSVAMACIEKKAPEALYKQVFGGAGTGSIKADIT